MNGFTNTLKLAESIKKINPRQTNKFSGNEIHAPNLNRGNQQKPHSSALHEGAILKVQKACFDSKHMFSNPGSALNSARSTLDARQLMTSRLLT